MAATPPDAAKKGHTRGASSTDERRVAVPRRRTKGPLDFEENPPFKPAPDNPLMPSSSSSSSASRPATPRPATPPLLASSPSPNPTATATPAADFTPLRHPQNFHPLPSHTLPPSFLNPALQPPPGTPLLTLLTTSHFRSAAITAANTITSTTHPLSPRELFTLWYVRLAALTLIGGTPTAAQEIKALGDLSSDIYQDPQGGGSLLLWELRVLAVRLQAIGYNDYRRSISAYYDLAREARSMLPADRGLWGRRLGELGVRVGSALVEMGDFGAAARHLEGLRMQGTGAGLGGVLGGMLCLLYIRVGNLAAARRCVPEGGDGVMEALFEMAEGRWEEAVAKWREGEGVGGEMGRCNLAVCLLYTGRLEEARKVLEDLVDESVAFPGLTFNLATIYELCSDSSKALKTQLSERVAKMGGEMVNTSFKM